MADITHISFNEPARKISSSSNRKISSSSNIVTVEASTRKPSLPKDEEATFGAPIDDPTAVADGHANAHEIDKKKKQVGKAKGGYAITGLVLIPDSGISRFDSAMVRSG